MKLRSLTDEEYEHAEKLATPTPLTHCPTCGAKPTVIPDSGGATELINGTYRLRGEAHECDCATQIKLRTHYLAANIPSDYHDLDWAEYDRDPTAKDLVDDYLGNWEAFRRRGIGFLIASKNLGTGKTLLATYIAKELVKRGQRVYFVAFQDMVAAFERNGDRLEEKMKTIPYLVLDDVLASYTDRQRDFYAHRLEAIIRHRTNFNLTTIITTNLEPDELEQEYPRTFSLLSLKQVKILLSGPDARANIGMENIEMAVNGETRPIT